MITSTKREQLQDAYVPRWLAALHALDSIAFANKVFSVSVNIASEEFPESPESLRPHDVSQQDRKIVFVDRLLHVIIRLLASNVLFSAFYAILARWLDEVLLVWEISVEASSEPPQFVSVAQLFGGDEAYRSNRSSSISLQNDIIRTQRRPNQDPWHAIYNQAEKSLQGFECAVKWLQVIATSG